MQVANSTSLSLSEAETMWADVQEKYTLEMEEVGEVLRNSEEVWLEFDSFSLSFSLSFRVLVSV